MKTCLLVLCAILCAASTAVASNGALEMLQQHHQRTLRSAEDKTQAPVTITGGMSTHASIGTQCAYDEKKDASLYPCEGDAVCVRTSPLYGECFTKEAAATRSHRTDQDRDDDDDDEEDDNDEEKDGESVGKREEGPNARGSAQKLGGGSAAPHDDRVGNDVDADGDGDDDGDDKEEEESEEEEDLTAAKPPVVSA